MAVNDIYEVTVEYGYPDTVMQNVLHFRKTVEIEASMIQTAGNLNAAMAVIFYNAGKVLQSSDVVYRCCTAKRVLPEGGPVLTYYYGAGSIGTGPEEGCSHGVAAVVSKYSDLQSRHGRGRIYLGGIAVASQNDGVLYDTDHQNLVAFGAAVTYTDFTDAVDNEWRGVIYNRPTDPGGAFPNGGYQDITAVIARPVLASQRPRRNPHLPALPDPV